ncbi:FAD/NAD-binding domain-containing protein [Rickenella mellea]|uniref:Kynurenine 3-monooxygenase n=1 Tax=Rickenella mellea TaxID=50990 RepID=A0A4Y7QI98_9AGAM|nr:FAD/NAD-binding domain-containing protein [Rickenella mellea]
MDLLVGRMKRLMHPGLQRRTAVVVGAGPVGCLAALALAKQGWHVQLYDARPDPRLPSSKSAASLRSINLAISSRGIAALQAIDPAATTRFLETVIPMKGRMIHHLRGSQESQLYDTHGQCINSIDRGLLNEGLIDEVQAAHNVRVFFLHKLTTADFDRRVLSLRKSHPSGDEDVDVTFDLCIGADGSYSNVRRQLMRFIRMDYQQVYIPHEYIELKMPPARDSNGNILFPLDPNHLHIWPRSSFMLIALPNKDKSFTCTLFAPNAEFARLEDPTSALIWFKNQFPDAVPLIGERALLDDFKRNPRSPLIAIKANPYHYKDRVVILGDAAHSMVPFFGQGLNCGFEDVRVLDALMRCEHVDPLALAHGSGDSTDPNLARALQRYSESRHEDLVAICDLAMDNYVEMRHSVATPWYLFRRTLDQLFYAMSSHYRLTDGPLIPRDAFPSGSPAGWIPLYTMVTFRPDISYAAAKRKAEAQTRLVTALGWFTAVLGLSGLTIASLRMIRLVEKGV